jgi:anhydro-N-acetylmuramic acid kinase
MAVKNEYKVIGIMSGTSLDGLDVACCRFRFSKKWTYEISEAITVPYDDIWKDRLTSAPRLSGSDLAALHAEYGNFIGGHATKFIKKHRIKDLDLIASHGHTIFHQVDRSFTMQLGNGNNIYAATGYPVVYDFRSLDVALKGQGAPLVPVGDRHLFGEHDVCLNLGGIANISLERGGERVAWDVCFLNMGLNHLAAKAGKEYDDNGAMAASGKTDTRMLNELTAIYQSFRKKRPALGREGFEKEILPLLENENIPLANRMNTFCVAAVKELLMDLGGLNKAGISILSTGGGAYNKFFIDLLQEKMKGSGTLVIPDRRIIDFKEALVFAFLGVLRVRGEVNVLKSVTRAKADSCSGVLAGSIKG